MSRASRSLVSISFTILCALAVLVAAPRAAEASHLGGMTLTAQALDPANPRSVTIRATMFLRWSAYANPALNTFVPVSTLTFGDGTSSSFSVRVVAIDAADDRFVGELTMTHTYSALGTYVVRWDDCCRPNQLLDGNAGLAIRVSSQVSLVAGAPMTPRILASPELDMLINANNRVQLPIQFRAGDPAPVFSLTPISESGLNVASPPGLSLSTDGVMTWHPTIAGLYAVSVRATITNAAGVAVYATIDFPIHVTSTPTCHFGSCVTGAWTTGPWGACSAVCGDGTQTRTVTCVDPTTGTTLADDACDPADRPASSQGCTTPDTTAPAITCPTVAPVECTGPAGASATFTATANDLCDPDVAVACPGSGATYPLGVSQTACLAVDDSGNDASCSATITVVDTTPPSIACAAPATLECTGDQRASYDPVDATATDLCAPASVNAYGLMPFPLGVSTLLYAASDTSNNQATCTTSVTVEDTLPPTIACPPAQTVECTGNGRAQVDPGDALASDVCGAVAVSDPGALSLLVGTNVIPYTATDAVGHTVACTTDITVADTTAPTITCPAPVVAECTSAAGAVVTPAAASASDVCGGTSVSSPAAANYPLGTSTVTYVATDSAGLTASCSATIEVRDTTPPTFDPATLGPQDLGGACGAGAAGFVTPTATDGCGAATVSCATADLLPGANQVTCTATDAAGNVASASVTVNVSPGLRVVFESPLEDDNVANDVHTDADVVNLFKTGSTVVHKVKLVDCAGNDVTATAPVTVHLRVSAGADGGATNLINDLSDFAGLGDAGGLMVLSDGRYRFNLKTNPTEYPAGGRVFQSLVTVAYTSAPLVTVAAEDARLKSK